MSNTTVNDTPFTGKCKWFNNKTGFGFLTVVGGGDATKVGTDVFAHHSGIVVSSEQYRYLVQGEYVNFTIKASSDNNHSVQASDITGVFGGQLMCETRNDARIASDNNRDEGGGTCERVRSRGDGPRAGGNGPRAGGNGPRAGGGRNASSGQGNSRANNCAGGHTTGDGGSTGRSGGGTTAWAMTGADGFDVSTE